MAKRRSLAAIVAANVKAARGRMSHAKIAELSHGAVNAKTVSNIETQANKPQLDSIEAIAEVLALEPYLLLVEGLPEYIAAHRELPRLISAFIETDDDGREGILRIAELAARAADKGVPPRPKSNPSAGNG